MLDSVARRLNPPEPEYPPDIAKIYCDQFDDLAKKIAKEASYFPQIEKYKIAEEEVAKLLASWWLDYQSDPETVRLGEAAKDSKRRRRYVAFGLFSVGLMVFSISSGFTILIWSIALSYQMLWWNFRLGYIESKHSHLFRRIFFLQNDLDAKETTSTPKPPKFVGSIPEVVVFRATYRF